MLGDNEVHDTVDMIVVRVSVLTFVLTGGCKIVLLDSVDSVMGCSLHDCFSRLRSVTKVAKEVSDRSDWESEWAAGAHHPQMQEHQPSDYQSIIRA